VILFEIEVFEQTSDYCELRLSGTGGSRTRGLAPDAVEDLVAVVEDLYTADSAAGRWADSAQLRQLGERLYAFLDGEERWLSDLDQHPAGAVLRISGRQRLRQLPWELLATQGGFLAVGETAPVLPVRAASAIATLGAQVAAANRPLRVMFMATSPEGVEPELSYEAEEAAILAATAATGTELVVEESGSLPGLRFTAESYGAGYFDVLHVSGHATIHDGQPVFLVETELGRPAFATAGDIAQAMAGQWPRLVFVSGCLTGGAGDGGLIPSMSESLVRAGAPAVLGWALPVGDLSATAFASTLYGALAAGRALDHAIVSARQQLYRDRSGGWHLLRVYADRSPLSPIVTPLNTQGRPRIRVRNAGQAFLDPQTQQSRVAPRGEFVGRRRVIQRCLRQLKQPTDAPGAAQAIVLQGMGGLGKSTLASRLLERMPTHQRAVWYGAVDLARLRELTSKIEFPSMEQQAEANEILADERRELAVRLRYLFSGPLGDLPCLLVFDDFEKGNLEERDGGHVLSADMAPILPALLQAIRDTNSASRVIITSRYRFHPPAGTNIEFESLEKLNPTDQTKKLANLPNLRPEAPTPAAVKDRAVAAADGNPRMLEWLDRIITDPSLDIDALISAIEGEADRFRREDILAERLLQSQPVPAQQMLAKLNVIELPVPTETVHAVHPHPDVGTHIARTVALGLLEQGTDPDTEQPRYYVSNVLRPLLQPLLSDDEYTQACAAAARSLYPIWVNPDQPTTPPPP
jgi:hypothetical protein